MDVQPLIFSSTDCRSYLAAAGPGEALTDWLREKSPEIVRLTLRAVDREAPVE
jgi:hypothetical protein